METVILFKTTPFAFLSLPEMERAMMIAHFRERRLRKSHADHVQGQVMDKKSNAKPAAGPDQHAAFFGG